MVVSVSPTTKENAVSINSQTLENSLQQEYFLVLHYVVKPEHYHIYSQIYEEKSINNYGDTSPNIKLL